MLNRTRSRAAALVATLLVAAGLAVVVPTSAAVANPTCTPPAQASYDPGSGQYSCTVPGGGTPGTPGGGGGGGEPAEPTCDLEGFGELGATYAEHDPRGPYCMGSNICWDTEVFPPMANPAGEKPSEEAEARIRWCQPSIFGPPSSTAYWSEDDDVPSQLEQAQEAIGNIDLGQPTVNVSPAARTLVNLDTWFWVTGQQEQVSGSSAFGLVAIATFRSLSVNPGDGSDGIRCPFTASRGAAERDCFYTYKASSRRGGAEVNGRPAFRATARIVYDLRFEVGGNEVTVAGAPTTLEGPVGAVSVRVDEVQSTVTDIG